MKAVEILERKCGLAACSRCFQVGFSCFLALSSCSVNVCVACIDLYFIFRTNMSVCRCSWFAVFIFMTTSDPPLLRSSPPAGELLSGTPAPSPVGEALRCAQWSASPTIPLALASSRTPFVPPMPRPRPLCRRATCTSVQSIAWLVGAW